MKQKTRDKVIKMCKCKKAISVVVLTKDNGRFSFFKERPPIYYKEKQDTIQMSDCKDFMNLWYCNYIDLNEYRIRELNSEVTIRVFLDEKEQEAQQ